MQEMYDHSVVDLRKRLRLTLIELDATSHSPPVLCGGPLNKVHSIVRIRLFRHKILRAKTFF